MIRRPVLVLMYHGIDRVPAERDPHGMFVTPAAFRAQVERLLEAGIVPVTEQAYLAGLRGGPLPRKAALITFDDGYTGVGEYAAPFLASLDVPSVLYVPAGLLGGASVWLEPRHRHPLMSADEVREVARQGMAIGAHGFDHSDLTGLPDGDVRRHTVETKAVLEHVVGAPVRSFAFPYGTHNRRVREAVRAAGFQAAFAVHDPVDHFAVRRVDVNAHDTMRTFRLKLARFYPLARTATDRFPAARALAHDLLGRAPRDGQDPPVPAGAR
jgi:peptidoglycan/xylan/chitin deacetylase (PgdA/CDA1 family)